MEDKCIKVLLVEDNLVDATFIREILSDVERPLFEIEWVDKFAKASDCLDKDKFDLILLDLSLPDSSGLDTLIKIHSQAVEVPIIVLTGLDDKGIAVDAVHAGAQDYLVKGQVNCTLLVQASRYAIERKRVEVELLRYQQHLEELVAERTAGLVRGNEQLQNEIRERKKVESELIRQKNLFDTMFKTTPDLLMLKDRNLVYLAVNAAFCNFVGKSEEEIIGKTDLSLFPADEAERYMADDAAAIESRQQRIQDEAVTGKTGVRWLQSAKAPVIEAEGECVGLLCSVRDITERKRAAEELRKAHDELELRVKERTIEIAKTNRELQVEIAERKQIEAELKRKHNLQSVLNAMLSVSMKPYSLEEILNRILKQIFSVPWLELKSKGAVFLLDDNNKRALILKSHCGFSEELKNVCARVPVGKCICGRAALIKEIQFVDHVNELHDNRYEGMLPHGHYCIPIIASDKLLGILVLYLADGHHRSEEEEIFLKSIANVLAGIIERKILEDQLNKLAHFDLLTGLPNRKLFFDRLNQLLALSKRSNSMLAVLFLDLDGFKKVNDMFGHKTGDILLYEVACRMKHCVREADTVARIGGDEFTIILTDIKKTQDVLHVAQKVIESFGDPFFIFEHECVIGVSVGISIYPHDGRNVETLLINADSAMYAAKADGHNNYHCYDAEMRTKFLERVTKENELSKAIKENDLVLYYQPQLDLHTGKIVTLEVLVRWQHSKQGLIMPKEFLPLAEETGLILEIDKWVLRTACVQYKAWEKANLSLPGVAVNISVQWFNQKGQLDVIKDILSETGVLSACLEVELNESVFMEDMEPVVRKLNALRSNGVALAIDGFGAGYSSLGYLKRFPVYKLKIDQSFIQGIDTNSNNNKAIVSAIINMAHSMNLKTVAEGVETRAQMEILRSLNCDEIQGFLVCRPMPANKLIDRLNAIVDFI